MFRMNGATAKRFMSSSGGASLTSIIAFGELTMWEMFSPQLLGEIIGVGEITVFGFGVGLGLPAALTFALCDARRLRLLRFTFTGDFGGSGLPFPIIMSSGVALSLFIWSAIERGNAIQDVCISVPM